MSTVLLVVIFGLLAGVAVGVQSPMASQISQRVGVMESVFIIHIGGAIAAAIILLARRGGNLGAWHEAPWYTLGAGIFGLVVVGAASYAIPRIGAVPTIVLIVAGQMVVSAIIDQLGLFGTSVRPLDVERLVGIVVLFVGVWLVVR